MPPQRAVWSCLPRVSVYALIVCSLAYAVCPVPQNSLPTMVSAGLCVWYGRDAHVPPASLLQSPRAAKC